MVRIVDRSSQEPDLVERLTTNDIRRVSTIKEQQAIDLQNHLAHEANRNPRLRRFYKRQEEEKRLSQGYPSLPSDTNASDPTPPINLQGPSSAPLEDRYTTRRYADAQTSPPRNGYSAEILEAPVSSYGYGENMPSSPLHGYPYGQRMPPVKQYYHEDEAQTRYFSPRPPEHHGVNPYKAAANSYRQNFDHGPQWPAAYTRPAPMTAFQAYPNSWAQPETLGYYKPQEDSLAPYYAYARHPPKQPAVMPPVGLPSNAAPETPGGGFLDKLGSRNHNSSAKSSKLSYADELRKQIQEKETRRRTERAEKMLPVLNPANQASVTAPTPWAGERQGLQPAYQLGQQFSAARTSDHYGVPTPAPHSANDLYSPAAAAPYASYGNWSAGIPKTEAYEYPSSASSGAARSMDMIGSSSQSPSEKTNKQARYMAELQTQIELKHQQKVNESERQRLYDLKKEKEIQDYNPFGKGGSGAAMYDSAGNLITNTKRLAKIREANSQLPNDAIHSAGVGDVASPVGSLNAFSGVRFDAQKSPSTQKLVSLSGATERVPQGSVDSPSNVASGFGGALPSWQQDEARKRQIKQQEYQMELQRQIEAQKLAKILEQKKIKEEEELEIRKIENDLVSQRQRYEEEQTRLGKTDKIPTSKGPVQADPFAPSTNNTMATLPQSDASGTSTTNSKLSKSKLLQERQAIAEEAYIRAKAEAEELKKNQRLARAGKSKVAEEASNVREYPTSANYSLPPRQPSPPIPTLRKAVEDAGTAELARDGPLSAPRYEQTSADVQQATKLVIATGPRHTFDETRDTVRHDPGSNSPFVNRSGRDHPSSADSSRQTTLQILDQLATIQMDLELQKLKVQDELKKPLLPAQPVKVSVANLQSAPSLSNLYSDRTQVAVLPAPRVERSKPEVYSQPTPAMDVVTIAKEAAPLKSSKAFDLPVFKDPIFEATNRLKAMKLADVSTAVVEPHEEYISGQKRILDQQERELVKLRKQVQMSARSMGTGFPGTSAVRSDDTNLESNLNSSPLFPTYTGTLSNSSIIGNDPSVIALQAPSMQRSNSNSSVLAKILPMTQLNLQSLEPSANDELPLLSLEPNISLFQPILDNSVKPLPSQSAIVPL